LTVYGRAVYPMGVVSFIETKLFTRLVGEYLSDTAYAALQKTLSENP